MEKNNDPKTISIDYEMFRQMQAELPPFLLKRVTKHARKFNPCLSAADRARTEAVQAEERLARQRTRELGKQKGLQLFYRYSGTVVLPVKIRGTIPGAKEHLSVELDLQRALPPAPPPPTEPKTAKEKFLLAAYRKPTVVLRPLVLGMFRDGERLQVRTNDLKEDLSSDEWQRMDEGENEGVYLPKVFFTPPQRLRIVRTVEGKVELQPSIDTRGLDTRMYDVAGVANRIRMRENNR